MKRSKTKAARKSRKPAATRRAAKKPARKKAAARKVVARKPAVRKSMAASAPMVRAYANDKVIITAHQVDLPHRGQNYLMKLDFSQAPSGAGTFENAMYSVLLHSTDVPEAVIQEDQNCKTDGICGWTIYVPDDGYQSPVTVTVDGEMSGTGWTGGDAVDGLWLDLEALP
ncbi:MAG: hypothetical protein HZA91_08325 [Verrucomicrobia bacterium]|nr:hypothetical protein [Verrucomicrobiota bacterium]